MPLIEPRLACSTVLSGRLLRRLADEPVAPDPSCHSRQALCIELLGDVLD
jgi:hypothetical protein